MSVEVHAHGSALTLDQWAWEFLRRNTEYQSDYRHFITLWQALEADYGAPPHRDFARWKRDPRAYGPLDGSCSDALREQNADLCIGEDDHVFLECWMGAKWGFHKFPLDPERVTPPSLAELSWRPLPAPGARPADDAYRLDIPFDLSLPLPPQLEAAKFRLVSRAAELRRNGLAVPMSAANQGARWTQMLRVLDVWSAGGSIDEQDAELLREAQAMVQGGYRDILRLAEASAGGP